jgi:hypothetical protein
MANEPIAKQQLHSPGPLPISFGGHLDPELL